MARNKSRVKTWTQVKEENDRKSLREIERDIKARYITPEEVTIKELGRLVITSIAPCTMFLRRNMFLGTSRILFIIRNFRQDGVKAGA